MIQLSTDEWDEIVKKNDAGHIDVDETVDAFRLWLDEHVKDIESRERDTMKALIGVFEKYKLEAMPINRLIQFALTTLGMPESLEAIEAEEFRLGEVIRSQKDYFDLSSKRLGVKWTKKEWEEAEPEEAPPAKASKRRK